MSILANEHSRVLVQGITGREAKLRVRLMTGYGTQVVAGVTPGKGGQDIDGIPVYDTVQEAVDQHIGIDVSCIFVPAAVAKEAAIEAMDAGMKVITLHPERVPQRDMIEVIDYSRQMSSCVIGPNTIGFVSPGKALIGMIGGRPDLAQEFFRAGPVGVLSRSGGNTTTVCCYLNQAGLGQTTAIGTGGDAFLATPLKEFLALFEEDPETRMVAIFGEIGTEMEEEAAEFIAGGGFTKPVVAYVAGRFARPDVRFGHAGAMVSRGRGTAQGKIEALRAAGVTVVEHFGDIGHAAREMLAEAGSKKDEA